MLKFLPDSSAWNIKMSNRFFKIFEFFLPHEKSGQKKELVGEKGGKPDKLKIYFFYAITIPQRNEKSNGFFKKIEKFFRRMKNRDKKRDCREKGRETRQPLESITIFFTSVNIT